MITAVYNREKHRLTVEGHAGSGEAGHDLVCASASILVYTLAGNVMQLCEDHSRVRRPRITLEEGNAFISCTPVHGMGAVTTLVFDSICSGFDILAEKYPEFISYKVLG